MREAQLRVAIQREEEIVGRYKQNSDPRGDQDDLSRLPRAIVGCWSKVSRDICRPKAFMH